MKYQIENYFSLRKFEDYYASNSVTYIRTGENERKAQGREINSHWKMRWRESHLVPWPLEGSRPAAIIGMLL
jgi:hypothetical protein